MLRLAAIVVVFLAGCYIGDPPPRDPFDGTWADQFVDEGFTFDITFELEEHYDTISGHYRTDSPSRPTSAPTHSGGLCTASMT